MDKKKKDNVPIWQKYLLTIEEAALYTNIGQNRIASLMQNPTCPFMVRVGRKRLVKREAFENYLRDTVNLD